MCTKRILFIAIIMLNTAANILTFSSCSSLQAGLYLVSIDNNNGNTILKNEPDVKITLENIAALFEYYTIKAFSRTGVNFQVRQTKLLTHSYYLITSDTGEYHTLSFYGTKMAFYSEGAWAYDADSDISSYRMYAAGDNKWDVRQLFQDKTINTRRTIQNIINKIDSNTTYYYKDHITNKSRMDNCNTALSETIVLENQP
jgi:hypothetical protein